MVRSIRWQLYDLRCLGCGRVLLTVLVHCIEVEDECGGEDICSARLSMREAPSGCFNEIVTMPVHIYWGGRGWLCVAANTRDIQNIACGKGEN